MPIVGLTLRDLGPFEEIAFEFDPHLNIFVGPNNCGKTTVLVALADILLSSFPVPAKFLRQHPQFSVRFLASQREPVTIHGTYPIPPPEHGSTIPSLPFEDSAAWTKERVLDLRSKVARLGYRVFIPALRVSTDFRSPSPAPQLQRSHENIFLAARREPTPAVSDDPASSIRDACVIQKMIELDYRAYRENKPAIRQVIDTIAEIVSEVTEGFPIRFAGIGEDDRGLFPRFTTPDGPLPLNVLSQGTQSLLQWCAHLAIGYAEAYNFPRSLEDKPGILLVDEIDAHLHPSWQRRILPALSSRFPSLQIFCATHSPMTLSGVKAGQVHLLRRDAQGRLNVTRNESDIVGWTADEIYSSLLAIAPTDLRTSEKLERLSKLRAKPRLRGAEKHELESLRDDLGARLSQGPCADRAGVLAERLLESARVPGSRVVRPVERGERGKGDGRPQGRGRRGGVRVPERV